MPNESKPTLNDAPGTQPLPSKAETVLAAAGQVFLTHGFSAATTDMIQREAGVSKSTVYAHYPNKEALFVAVIERHCARLAHLLDNIAFEPGNLRQALMALGGAYLRTVVSPNGLALYRTVVAEAPRFPQLARTFYRAGTRVVLETTSKCLAQAAAAGEVDLTSIGLETATLTFAGLVRSEPQLHYLMHPEARPSAEQVDQWVSCAVGTFLRAYGRRAEMETN
jgi:AcrR family transcriptional regulator